MHALRELPGWDVVLLRTRPLIGRPAIPRDLAGRVHVRTARDAAGRAAILNPASIFVPGVEGLRRVTLEAAAAGCAIARPRGVAAQPELAAAAAARLAEDDGAARARGRLGAGPRQRRTPSPRSPHELEELYTTVGKRRRKRRHADPLADRPWIVADLHMHTSWSHDCSIDAAELVDHAEAEGLGAIAVTDHNVFGGALEAADYARGRDLVVIPGEEVKTDEQGEVIGLFLQREIPRGLSFADTIAAIREQDGLVYVPHPFDRLHAIPDPRTLHRHLADIDVLEVYNARLAVRGLQRRGAALRAEVQPDDGRRLRRPRPAGGRDGRAADARIRATRRSSCSRCGRPKSCVGPSRSPTSSRSSGWPRSRRRSARRRSGGTKGPPAAWPPS